MDKPEILQRLEYLRVTVSVKNDRIRLRPSSRIPPALVEEIRENKADLIDYLKRGEAGNSSDTVTNSTIDEASQDELQDIERIVYEKGFVLLWSSALEDFVAFYHLEIDKAHIPPGFVLYSVQELWHLFGNEEDFLSNEALRLIHKAKKTGAIITGSEEDQS